MVLGDRSLPRPRRRGKASSRRRSNHAVRGFDRSTAQDHSRASPDPGIARLRHPLLSQMDPRRARSDRADREPRRAAHDYLQREDRALAARRCGNVRDPCLGAGRCQEPGTVARLSSFRRRGGIHIRRLFHPEPGRPELEPGAPLPDRRPAGAADLFGEPASSRRMEVRHRASGRAGVGRDRRVQAGADRDAHRLAGHRGTLLSHDRARARDHAASSDPRRGRQPGSDRDASRGRGTLLAARPGSRRDVRVASLPRVPLPLHAERPRFLFRA